MKIYKVVKFFTAIAAGLLAWLVVGGLIGGFIYFYDLGRQTPIPVVVLTMQEETQLSCLAKIYRLNPNFVVWDWPEKPYIMWKGHKVYLDKGRCQQPMFND